MKPTPFYIACFSLLCFLLIASGFSGFKQQDNRYSFVGPHALEGGWKCIHIECEKICETCCENLVYLDFLVAGDSISFFKYPYQYFGTYRIETDSLRMKYGPEIQKKLESAFAFPLPNSSRSHIFSALEFLNCNLSALSISNDTLRSGNRYVRQTFDPKIIKQLKKDSVNLNSLAGKWKLVDKYSNGYEGDMQSDGFYHIGFPFKLPVVLALDAKTLSVNGRWLKMDISGKQRDFYIANVRANGFTIVPGAWFKEPLAIEYER